MGSFAGHVDHIVIDDREPTLHVSGWLVDTSNQPVSLKVGFRELELVEVRWLERDDIASLFPNCAWARRAGFEVDLIAPDELPESAKLFFLATYRHGDTVAGAFPPTIITRSIGEGEFVPATIDAPQLPESAAIAVPSPAYGALRKVGVDLFLSQAATVFLQTSATPEISIIVHVTSDAESLLSMLQSLEQIRTPAFEVVLYDSSNDPDVTNILDRVQGAVVIAPPFDVPASQALREAAVVCHAPLLLLLDDKATLYPGTLGNIVQTFADDPEVGIVGGRLLDGDGLLISAGGILWRDGAHSLYGAGQLPTLPEFSFQRDVHFVPRQLLAVRKELFETLGGFDQRYGEKIYEDLDLCTRAAEHGFMIRYEPLAAAYLLEPAVSSLNNAQATLFARALYEERHQRFLQHHSASTSIPLLVARTAATPGQRILVLDDSLPLSDAIPSSPTRIAQVINELVSLGHLVTFLPMEGLGATWPDIYRKVPRSVEVLRGYDRHQVQALLAERSGVFDSIFVSKAHVMEFFAPIIPTLSPRPRIIYDAEMVFSLRELAATTPQASQSLTTQELEFVVDAEVSVADAADVVLTVSEDEAGHFRRRGKVGVHVLGHSLTTEPTSTPYRERSGVLSVGSYRGQSVPKGDGVLWYLDEIQPLIRKTLGDQAAHITLAALSKAERLRRPFNTLCKVATSLDDLLPLYDHARVCIVPARSGIGMTRRVLEAAAHGVPVVTTPELAEQIGWTVGVELLVGNTTKEFAEACVQLYQSPHLWEQLRTNALNQVTTTCSPQAFGSTLRTALGESTRKPQVGHFGAIAGMPRQPR